MNGIEQHDDFTEQLTEILTQEAASHRPPVIDAFVIADQAARRNAFQRASAGRGGAGGRSLLFRPPILAATAVLAVAAVGTTVAVNTGGRTNAGAGPGIATPHGPQVMVGFTLAAGATRQQLDAVAEVLKQRAAAEGLIGVDVTVAYPDSGGKVFVDGREVVLRPLDIVVTGRATDKARLEALGGTATLHFRQVAASRSASKSPGSAAATPPTHTDTEPSKGGTSRQTAPDAQTTALYTSVDCTHPPVGLRDAQPQNYSVACSSDRNTVYLLAPSDVSGADLAGAAAREASTSTGMKTGNWEIDLTLDAAAAKVFGTVTGQLAMNGGQFAVEVDGVVYSAPTASEAITDGHAQITGNFTETSARDLVTLIAARRFPVSLTYDVTIEESPVSPSAPSATG